MKNFISSMSIVGFVLGIFVISTYSVDASAIKSQPAKNIRSEQIQAQKQFVVQAQVDILPEVKAPRIERVNAMFRDYDLKKKAGYLKAPILNLGGLGVGEHQGVIVDARIDMSSIAINAMVGEHIVDVNLGLAHRGREQAGWIDETWNYLGNRKTAQEAGSYARTHTGARDQGGVHDGSGDMDTDKRPTYMGTDDGGFQQEGQGGSGEAVYGENEQTSDESGESRDQSEPDIGYGSDEGDSEDPWDEEDCGHPDNPMWLVMRDALENNVAATTLDLGAGGQLKNVYVWLYGPEGGGKGGGGLGGDDVKAGVGGASLSGFMIMMMPTNPRDPVAAGMTAQISSIVGLGDMRGFSCGTGSGPKGPIGR